MKKLFLLAAATLGMLLSTSCNKDENSSSSEKKVTKAVAVGKVIVTKDLLTLGTAKLKCASKELKTFSLKDTVCEYTVDYTSFPCSDSIQLVVERNTTPLDTNVKYWLGYYQGSGIGYYYSDGTSQLPSISLEAHVAQYSGKKSGGIASYYNKSPKTIFSFSLDKDGKLVK